MNSDQEQEIIRIGKNLEKITHNDHSNEEEALDLLKTLQGCVMSLDVLQKSRVGLSVNKIRQKYAGKEAASVAKKLIKSWKKLLPTAQNPSPESTPKSGKNGSSSPKSVPPGGATGKLSSPPPVVYSKQQSDSSHSDSVNTNSQKNGGDIPSRRLSSTSDEIILTFPSSVDGYSRMSPTGSEVRDRCRDLLAKALKKGLEDVSVSITEETQFYNLAAQIEEKIYGEFKDSGTKYKQRVRSRISNLGDIRNPSLRQNVIWGQISPSRIAVMTTDEMASDAMKKLRQQFTKEAIRDAQVSTQGGTKTSLLKCGKCKKRNCTYTQAQTRSADEPMTTFAYCNECGHRWKFC